MQLICLENVTKRFRSRRGARVLIGRGGMADWIRGCRTSYFEALKDVSLKVNQGECLGIIGHNGSGKSTLLKLIAGVSIPTAGRVTVRGRVASLLELGAGFHPMLTGRENIYLNGSLLGMRRSDVARVFDDIVEFSGIGGFIDSPVDTYSSGMFVRLGFSVAVHSNPDVFLVDEVLNVGDEAFQRQCRKRIGELMEQGKTIVFVSHDLNIVNTLCDRVVLMSQGALLHRGTPHDTIEFYLRQVGGAEAIHTFRQDRLEGILCHGRLNLYQDEREMTGPQGLSIRIRSLGQDHHSGSASWRVTERHVDGCTAVGQLFNLPLSLIYEIVLDGDRLRWRVTLDVRREVRIDAIFLAAFFPAGYVRWVCGDFAGNFPPIDPGDQEQMLVAPTQYGYGDAAAVPSEGSLLPPAIIEAATPAPFKGIAWFNTPFLESNRLCEVFARFGQQAEGLLPGRHHVFDVSVRLAAGPGEVEGWIRDRLERRNILAGPLTARFHQGAVHLLYDGEELTKGLHVYSGMLIGGLWNESGSLKWDAPERSDGVITVTGQSRRFPFRQHWRLSEDQGAITIAIELEALEPIEVQEYQVSALLHEDYARWRTSHEEGDFPPFDPNSEDWRHLNHAYEPGTTVEALSHVLPCVKLTGQLEACDFRPTVINTDAHDRGRVLQLLRTGARGGAIRFEKGRWPYFAGRITVFRVSEA